jgi:hypothetical protein
MSIDVPAATTEVPGLCPNPVFIVGSARSGTTALAWSLHRHSHLWTSGESYILFDIFNNKERLDQIWQRARDSSDTSWFHSEKVSKEEYYRYLGLGPNVLFTSRSQGKRWVDHTPHYAMMLEVLAAMFPGALFLHILRDSRRVVHSMINFQNRLVTGGRKADTVKDLHVPGWAKDFREACKTWRRHVRAGVDFCQRHPDRGMTVVNEWLVAEPEERFRDLFNFIGVPYEEAPVAYFRTHRLNSSFQTSPNEAAARPDEPWKEWTAEQQGIFTEELGDITLPYSFVPEHALKRSEVPAPVPSS